MSMSNNDYYNYLEWLRRTGTTNMFGAGIYLEEEFDLDESEARKILMFWMNHYDELQEEYYDELQEELGWNNKSWNFQPTQLDNL